MEKPGEIPLSDQKKERIKLVAMMAASMYDYRDIEECHNTELGLDHLVSTAFGILSRVEKKVASGE